MVVALLLFGVVQTFGQTYLPRAIPDVTSYTKGLLTNSTAASARGYLGIVGGTNSGNTFNETQFTEDADTNVVVKSGATLTNVVLKAEGDIGTLVTATGASVARSLEERFGEVVNVKDYGATDNGSSSDDDQAGLQAALNTGKDVEMVGTYYFTPPLLVTQNNIKISGKATLVPLTYSAGNAGLVQVTATNVIIEGLVVDANTNANRGIRIRSGSTNVTLRNVTVKNLKQSASETDQAAGIRIEDGTDDILIENPRIYGVDGASVTISRGILISSPGGGTRAPRVRIVGGSIEGVTPTTDGDGIVVQDFTSGGPITITGTHFSRTMKRAIKIQSPNVHVSEIKVDGADVTYSGVSIYASNVSLSDSQMTNGVWTTAVEIGSTIVSVTNVVLTGNTLQISPSFDISGTGDGVQVNGTNTTRVIIGANTVQRARFGIRTQGYVHHGSYGFNTYGEIGQSAEFFGANGGVSPSHISVVGSIYQSVTNYGVRVSSGTNISVINPIGDPAFGNDVSQGVNCSMSEMTSDGWESIVSDEDDEFNFLIDGYSRTWINKNGVMVQNTNTAASDVAVFTALNENTYVQMVMLSTNAAFAANRGYIVTGTNSPGITYNTINAAGTHKFAVNAATTAEVNTNGMLVYGNLTLSSNNAYSVSWNGSLKVPTEDAVYDILNTFAPSFVVREGDSSPSLAPTQIVFPNGTLTDLGGGVVEYTPSGGGGGTPGGSSLQIQFNNAGSFGGASGLTTDASQTNFNATGEVSANTVNATNLNVRGPTGTAVITIEEHGSAPGTPPSGFVYLYMKADGKAYIKDDAGTETDLTATGAGTLADGDYGDITVSSSGTVWTIDANSVALGTETTGNYMTDVAGTANEITVTHTPAEGSTATISLPSAIDLGGKTSFEIPNSAAPSTSVAGQFALDTTITDHKPLLQYYSGAEEMLVVAFPRSTLSTTDGHILKYSAANDRYEPATDATGGGGLADGDYGEVTVSSSATVFTLDGGDSDYWRGKVSDENGTGAWFFQHGNVGSATVSAPSAADDSNRIPSTAWVRDEVDTTHAGSFASPDTTAPLAPTWTGLGHIVWTGIAGEIDLPAAATYSGRWIILYNTGAFAKTIDPNGSEIIVLEGVSQGAGNTIALQSGAGNYVKLISDGTRWIVLENKGVTGAGLVGTLGASFSAIAAGQYRTFEVPWNCTITGWTITGDTTGSAQFDVWVEPDPYDGSGEVDNPATVTETITASAKPAVTAKQGKTSTTLTGWTTQLTAGSQITIYVDSASGFGEAALQLKVRKQQ